MFLRSDGCEASVAKMPVSITLEKRMLTRRRFLGYSALAPAALRPTLWANPLPDPAPQISRASMGRA